MGRVLRDRKNKRKEKDRLSFSPGDVTKQDYAIAYGMGFVRNISLACYHNMELFVPFYIGCFFNRNLTAKKQNSDHLVGWRDNNGTAYENSLAGFKLISLFYFIFFRMIIIIQALWWPLHRRGNEKI